jgi:hypothetical protein
VEERDGVARLNRILDITAENGAGMAAVPQ